MLSKIAKAAHAPSEAVRVLRATVLGYVVKLWYATFNTRITIGKKFRAYSWFYIKGPGSVTIGDSVSAETSFLRSPSILTHLPSSEVRIGKGSYLGGTRISCVDKVEIGEESLLGSTTIIDSIIIPHAHTVLNFAWIKLHAAPIRLGGHFWAGTNSFILKGSIVGDECVLGAGSVIFDKAFPDQSLLMGNPARRMGGTRSE